MMSCFSPPEVSWRRELSAVQCVLRSGKGVSCFLIDGGLSLSRSQIGSRS